MGNLIDLTGRRFGVVTVLGRMIGPTTDVRQSVLFWDVLCDCGNQRAYRGYQLRNGVVTTCGDWTVHRPKGRSNNRWSGGELISGKWWSNREHAAKRRKILWELDIPYAENLIREQNFACAYTRFPLTITTHDRLNTASIDRIDSSIGYVVGNVQWVHQDVNKAKQQLSHTEFINLCKAVAQNFLA